MSFSNILLYSIIAICVKVYMAKGNTTDTCDKRDIMALMVRVRDMSRALQAKLDDQDNKLDDQDNTIRELRAENKKMDQEIDNLKDNVIQLNNILRAEQVVFYVHSPKSQTTTAVLFSEVVTNIGNGYSARTGHFTASVAGVYMFSASVSSVSAGGEDHHCDVTRNSEVTSGISTETGNDQDHKRAFAKKPSENVPCVIFYD